jgi:hypothetical protein
MEALVVALLGTLVLATAFLSVIGYQIYHFLKARPLLQDGAAEGTNPGIEEAKICRYESSGCPACIRCAVCDQPVCTLYAEGSYCKVCIQAVSPVGAACQCAPCRGPAMRFCATCGTPVCDRHTEGDHCGSCAQIFAG